MNPQTLAACPEPTAESSRGRIIGLDALRGVAAITVLLFHYTRQYQELYGHTRFVPAFHWGRNGVLLFFIISGFVILMTLERAKSARHFVQSRFARLYPAFWVCMPLSYVLVGWLGLPNRSVTVRDFLVNFTMIPRPLGAREVDGVYWTLLVEILFYALMLAVKLIGWIGYATYILIVFVVIGTVDAMVVRNHLPPALGPLRTFSSYAYCFLIGVVLYQSWRDRRLGSASAVAIVVAVAFGVIVQGWVVGLSVAVFAAVVYLATHRTIPFLASTPLLFLGTISYTLYLLHQNIGYGVIRKLEGQAIHPYFAIAIAAVFCVGLATLVSYLVERPANRLLRPAK